MQYLIVALGVFAISTAAQVAAVQTLAETKQVEVVDPNLELVRAAKYPQEVAMQLQAKNVPPQQGNPVMVAMCLGYSTETGTLVAASMGNGVDWTKDYVERLEYEIKYIVEHTKSQFNLLNWDDYMDAGAIMAGENLAEDYQVYQQQLGGCYWVMNNFSDFDRVATEAENLPDAGTTGI